MTREFEKTILTFFLACAQLYHENNSTLPIAWFQSSRSDVVGNNLRSALLALGTGSQGIVDAIVVSLLVVEQGLRVKETRNRNI